MKRAKLVASALGFCALAACTISDDAVEGGAATGSPEATTDTLASSQVVRAKDDAELLRMEQYVQAQTDPRVVRETLHLAENEDIDCVEIA